MSRSSKGFADFFPTAPSVLQQKRSRAVRGQRGLDHPAAGGTSPTVPTSITPALSEGEGEGENTTNGMPNSEPGTVQSHLVQEESECTQGDLLNGVGSASSSSTVSSVFSASHRTLNALHNHGAPHSTNLTPLTNVDLSPPRHAMESPKPKAPISGTTSTDRLAGARTSRQGSGVSKNLGPAGYTCLKRLSARPYEGEIKGEKLKYDPDPKERKSKRPVYEPFGQNVRLQPNYRYDIPPITDFGALTWKFSGRGPSAKGSTKAYRRNLHSSARQEKMSTQIIYGTTL